MESIDKVASMAMTVYYKGLRPANGEYRLNHFIWLCIAADNKIKQDEYDLQLRYQRSQRLVNVPILMSADNYMSVTVDVKDGKAILPAPIMSFSGDSSILGVLSVTPVGNCKPFIRLTPEQEWQACNIKDVVFWTPEQTIDVTATPDECNSKESVIKFLNLNSNICKVDKVNVKYIAMLNGDSIVQESRKWAILNLVTIFVKSAKEGTVVDMSNDGNVNTTIATEVNKYLTQAIQKGR